MKSVPLFPKTNRAPRTTWGRIPAQHVAHAIGSVFVEMAW